MRTASEIIDHCHDPVDTITLDETARHRRRIALKSDGGIEFLLDLPTATLLRHRQGLVLDAGAVLAVGGACTAGGSPSWGRVLDRWGARRSALVALIAASALVAPLGMLDSVANVVVAFVAVVFFVVSVSANFVFAAPVVANHHHDYREYNCHYANYHHSNFCYGNREFCLPI